MTLATSSDLSIARYATKRTPDRVTLGSEVAAIAKTLGTPLLPWQRQVADVALEMVEDESGLLRPAFREVIFTVPRQSGKTTLLLALELQRALRFATPQRIAYTAQTGWDARRKLIDSGGGTTWKELAVSALPWEVVTVIGPGWASQGTIAANRRSCTLKSLLWVKDAFMPLKRTPVASMRFVPASVT